MIRLLGISVLVLFVFSSLGLVSAQVPDQTKEFVICDQFHFLVPEDWLTWSNCQPNSVGTFGVIDSELVTMLLEIDSTGASTLFADWEEQGFQPAALAVAPFPEANHQLIYLQFVYAPLTSLMQGSGIAADDYPGMLAYLGFSNSSATLDNTYVSLASGQVGADFTVMMVYLVPEADAIVALYSTFPSHTQDYYYAPVLAAMNSLEVATTGDQSGAQFVEDEVLTAINANAESGYEQLLMTAEANIDATQIVSGCQGYTTADPTFQFQAEGEFIGVAFSSDMDVSIIVQGPGDRDPVCVDQGMYAEGMGMMTQDDYDIPAAAFLYPPTDGLYSLWVVTPEGTPVFGSVIVMIQ